MNLTRTMKDMEKVYTEKVNFPPKGTFELAKDAKEKKKPFVGKTTGPEASVGFQKDISDPEKLKGKETFQGTEKLSSQNFNENSEKIEQKNINNFMSKSIFDKLFEDVMGVEGADTEAKDALDLGVGAEAGHEAGHEEGGEVTITLDRELAKKLHDVLMGVLGAEEHKEEEAAGEEAAGEEGASEDAEEEEKKEEVAGEAVDAEVVGHAIVDSEKLTKGLCKTDNKVGDVTKNLVAKGEGDGKIKDGADGKLHPQKEVGATSPKGKANVVASKVSSNVGQYLFKK